MYKYVLNALFMPISLQLFLILWLSIYQIENTNLYNIYLIKDFAWEMVIWHA